MESRVEDTYLYRLRDSPKFSWILDIRWQRRLSLAITITFIVVSLLAFQPKSLREGLASILLKFLSVLFPLACIWFGDELGDYLRITNAGPSWMVRLGGWLLLFMRLIFWWLVYEI